MKKKLLLVSVNRFADPYPVFPLAIAYLTTYLKSRLDGFEIHSFDFNVNDENDLVAKLAELKPEYIGVSIRNVDDCSSYSNSNFIEGHKKIIDLIRKNSDSVLIIGGSGYSIYYEKFFELLSPDYAVKGEGEESLYQLIMALENKTDIDKINGLVYRKKGKIILNPVKNHFDGLCLNFDADLVEFYWKQSGMLNVQTKRGCPYKCIYCTYPIIEGNDVRTLDADNIVDTLKELYNKKGIDYVFFTDSVFNLRNDFNIKLAEKIIQSGIKINWGAFFSPKNLNYDLLKLLKESGLSHIEFGTESLSDRQLENYGKQFTVSDVFKVSNDCLELRIFYAHYLIIGGYGETDETIDETMENSKKIERTVYFPYQGMRIYPGTKLQELAIADGTISADDDLIAPKYYLSKNCNLNLLKVKAQKTGKRWVFPDEDLSPLMQKIREKNRKGPLWEYLRM